LENLQEKQRMQEAKPNPISHPDGQLETQVALWLLGSLCNLHRRPFDARLVTQAYPPPTTLTFIS